MLGLGLNLDKTKLLATNYQTKIINRNPVFYVDATDSPNNLSGTDIISINSLTGSLQATQSSASNRGQLQNWGDYKMMNFNPNSTGQHQYLEIDTGLNTTFIGSWSISFVYFPQDPGKAGNFGVFGSLNATDGVRIWQTSAGALYLAYRANSSLVRWQSSGQVFPSARMNPALITFTFDNTIQGAEGIKCYLDGVELSNNGVYTGDTTGFDASAYSSSDKMFIAGTNETTDTFIRSAYGAVIIDGKVISAEEIDDMYQLYIAP